MDGKVAIISGASRGLGRAMALALASAGAKVALVSRDADRLAAVFGEIQASGSESQSSSLPTLPAKKMCAALRARLSPRSAGRIS